MEYTHIQGPPQYKAKLCLLTELNGMCNTLYTVSYTYHLVQSVYNKHTSVIVNTLCGTEGYLSPLVSEQVSCQ